MLLREVSRLLAKGKWGHKCTVVERELPSDRGVPMKSTELPPTTTAEHHPARAMDHDRTFFRETVREGATPARSVATAASPGQGVAITTMNSPSTKPLPLVLPIVLTVDELATLLRLERKTVYAAIRRGEIPGARRIGSTLRISRDSVLAWLAQGQGRVSRSRRSP
jgi:excisionase family DNA binding protein